MHAKMTRDRKKLFICSVEKTIAELEENNKRMRDILAKQAIQYSGSTVDESRADPTKSVTPESSPMLKSSKASNTAIPPLTPSTIALAPESNLNKSSKKDDSIALSVVA